MKRIDLLAFADPASRILAGRERGRAARNAARLEEAATSDDTIEVHVASTLFSVNSSFFLGMFEDTIRELGAIEFRRRFLFTGKPISRLVDACILEATCCAPLH